MSGCGVLGVHLGPRRRWLAYATPGQSEWRHKALSRITHPSRPFTALIWNLRLRTKRCDPVNCTRRVRGIGKREDRHVQTEEVKAFSKAKGVRGSTFTFDILCHTYPDLNQVQKVDAGDGDGVVFASVTPFSRKITRDSLPSPSGWLRKETPYAHAVNPCGDAKTTKAISSVAPSRDKGWRRPPVGTLSRRHWL